MVHDLSPTTAWMMRSPRSEIPARRSALTANACATREPRLHVAGTAKLALGRHRCARRTGRQSTGPGFPAGRPTSTWPLKISDLPPPLPFMVPTALSLSQVRRPTSRRRHPRRRAPPPSSTTLSRPSKPTTSSYTLPGYFGLTLGTAITSDSVEIISSAARPQPSHGWCACRCSYWSSFLASLGARNVA